MLLPFVPVLFRRRGEEPPVKECPACGLHTRDPEVDYCPRDGTALDRDGDGA